MSNLKFLPNSQIQNTKSNNLSSKNDIKVIYITESLNAPFRYRCYNYQQFLTKLNYTAEIEVINDFSHYKIKNFNLVVLFRLSWDRNVKNIISEARKNNIPLVFDIDDYIFEPNEISNLPFYSCISHDEQLKYKTQSKLLAQTFEECDYFFGSTEQLVDIAKQKGKTSFLLPNLLSDEVLYFSKISNILPNIKNKIPIISYLSGSNTHDNDFNLISDVVKQILENGHVYFLIVGHLKLDPEFKKYENQIIRLPFVNWRILPFIQSLAWVNLAPLSEINNFTDSKSALKFFEAAAVKVPTISSPSREMKKYIKNSENGFIAENLGDWEKYINHCLNKINSLELGQKAQQYCLDNLTFSTNKDLCIDTLKRIIQKHNNVKQIYSAKPVISSHNQKIYKLSIKEKFSLYKILLKLNLKFNLCTNIKSLCSKCYSYKDVNNSEPQLLISDPQVDDDIKIDLKSNPLRIALFNNSKISPNLRASLNYPRNYIADSDDPYFFDINLPAEILYKKFLLIKQLCKTKDKMKISYSQIFWLSNNNDVYTEEYSIRFPIYPDGKVHQYCINLQEFSDKSLTKWNDCKNIYKLRFDPMSNSGIFQTLEFQFL